jgi:hypothetical protein
MTYNDSQNERALALRMRNNWVLSDLHLKILRVPEIAVSPWCT